MVLWGRTWRMGFRKLLLHKDLIEKYQVSLGPQVCCIKTTSTGCRRVGLYVYSFLDLCNLIQQVMSLSTARCA